jgi:hypothetical protein
MSMNTPEALVADRMTTVPVRRLGQSSDVPFRIGQVIDCHGLGHIPQTVTLVIDDFNAAAHDENTIEARCGMPPWDIQPGDAVLYLEYGATPVVIGRFSAGSPTLLIDDEDDDPDPWHIVGDAGEPAFGTNWQNNGGDTQTARFRKTSDGWVWLQGLVERTVDIGTDSTIFTLPVNYRPPENMYFVVAGTQDTATLHCSTSVGVSANTGNVFWHAQAGASPTGYVGLFEVCFPTRVNRSAWYHPDVAGGFEHLVTPVNNPNTPRAIIRQDGWVWWQGMLMDPSPPTAQLRIMTVDRLLANVPHSLMWGALANTTNPGRFDIGGLNASDIRTPLGIKWENPNSLLTDIMFGGMNYWPAGGAGAEAPWIDATLQNGWTVHTGAGNTQWGAPQYMIDAHGIVHLRGLPNESASTAATIFTLPAGFRPSARVLFHSVQNANAFGRIDIHPDGTVQDPFRTANNYGPSLTGMHFFAEQ